MLETGQLISDRYQLIEKLGRNAGRQTWLARDCNTEEEEKVVVKLLAFGGDVQWQDLKLFEREAQTLKQLNHPQIPRYKDYFSIDDRSLWFGLVQQYIPGLSLKQLLDGGKRFTEADIEHIAQEILEILLYLHGLHPPLLHRDIKPSNLIWGEDEQIYLVDFGAVQDRAATEGSTFTVVGTYGYTPIEQFGGRAVPASDLYALGATLIHLLTRTAPADLPNRELTIQFRDRLTLSPQLANWLEKITAPALEKRFSSAKQALEALKFKDEIDNIYPNNQIKSDLNWQENKHAIIKPINTKIKIYRYPKFVEIVIPEKGINRLAHLVSLFPVMIICISIGLPIFISLLPFSIWIVLILWLVFKSKKSKYNLKYFFTLKQIFTSTKIRLSRQNFVIQTSCLGVNNKSIGSTKEIQDVSVNYSSNHSKANIASTEAIIINTKSSTRSQFKRYLFGQGLTEEELIWLANEIRSWLAANS